MNRTFLLFPNLQLGNFKERLFEFFKFFLILELENLESDDGLLLLVQSHKLFGRDAACRAVAFAHQGGQHYIL